MTSITYIVGAGIALSIPQAVSTWLKWQTMKLTTAIPTGILTGRHGKAIGWVLQLGIWIVAIRSAPSTNLEWSVLAALTLSWFTGGWMATLLERKLYGTEELIGTLVHLVSEFDSYQGTLKEGLGTLRAELLETYAPAWWRRMMPTRWKSEFARQLAAATQRTPPNVEEPPEVS